MNKYACILRGINVAGARKMPMTELKVALSELPLTDIESYIQSGNLVFSTELDTPQVLEEMIASKIKQSFGYDDVPVMLLKADYLEAVIGDSPYITESDPKELHLTFLDQQPDEASIEALRAVKSGSDRLMLGDKVIYLHCPNGYGRTKLNNNTIERKLGLRATTRNWKTSIKLLEMLES